MARLERSAERPIPRLVLLGILSATLYIIVFSNQAAITDLFTRGGAYAVFPILAAFMVSFVHGAFVSYFWHAVGIRARSDGTEAGPNGD